MKKQIWITVAVIALLSVSFIVAAVAVEFQTLYGKLKKAEEQLLSILQEYKSMQKDYAMLQQNFTDQQRQFIEAFTPSLETRLGAKVLMDSKAGKNYLWITGEIYNAGYGIAFNSELEVKLFAANSSTPVVSGYSLGNIAPLNTRSIRHAFYSDVQIERWEINVNCSKAK